jgi:hypothetical protein
VGSRNEPSWLLAQKELQKINQYKAPRDKLVCLLNCCRVLNNMLNVCVPPGGAPPGADDFLPVLVYVVLRASPPQLASNLAYITRFRLASRLVSEAAYFFTNLVSAAVRARCATCVVLWRSWRVWAGGMTCRCGFALCVLWPGLLGDCPTSAVHGRGPG